MSYATPDDVFQLGLSAAAFVMRGRPADAVDGATATIRLKGHGLAASDVITFEVTSGGGLPTGITGFALYYPVPLSHDLIRVSTSSSGTPITSWASVGGGWTLVVDPSRRIQAHLDDTAAVIDEHLTAHDPPLLRDPLGKYPAVIVGLNARMAARAAVASLQIENPQYRVAVDRLLAREVQDLELLKDWKGGKPVHPQPVDETETADNAAQATYSFVRSPWTTNAI